MSTISIVDLNSLEDDTRINTNYTVEIYQYLHGSCGYYYNITMTKPGDASTHYLVPVRNGCVFDKLEKIKKKI
jgi:hypothetical protein